MTGTVNGSKPKIRGAGKGYTRQAVRKMAGSVRGDTVMSPNPAHIGASKAMGAGGRKVAQGHNTSPSNTVKGLHGKK